MARQPNVLFLVVDSLRYDAVFGPDACETPTIDALASDGVVFEECYAQGISTAPSMTSMLTGRYPLDFGGHWYIHDDQPTMAEEFRANGYTTAAIHSNPNVSRLRNFDKGFDTFEEHILPVANDDLVELLPDGILRYLNKGARLLRRTPYQPADVVNAQMREWIEETEQPWFVWTQYMDTHGPYLPRDDVTYRNKLRAERLWRKAAVEAPESVTAAEHEELRRNYRLEVEHLDAALGRFLEDLDRGGHLENTIVIVVGDHGEEFGEHGLYGHKNLPYEELVRVPALIRWPETFTTNAPDRVDSLVRAMDLLVTVFDVGGASLTDEMKDRKEAASIRPLWEGGQPRYDVVVTEKEMRNEDALRFGFRSTGWTYLYDGLEDREHLYERAADPDEVDDVLEHHPEVAARFRRHLSDRLDRIEATGTDVEHPEPRESTAVQERLRALGYRE